MQAKINNSEEHGPLQPFHYEKSKAGREKKKKKHQLNKTPTVITAGKLEHSY